MKRSKLTITPWLLLTTFGACAAETAADSHSAQRAANEISVALENKMTPVMADGSIAGDFKFSCPSGGSVALTKKANAETAATAGLALGLDLEIKFEGCDSGLGDAIDGGIALKQAAKADGLQLHYQGKVVFSGELNLACDVDVSADYTDPGAPKLGGSFCGLPIELIDFTLTNWLASSSIAL